MKTYTAKDPSRFMRIYEGPKFLNSVTAYRLEVADDESSYTSYIRRGHDDWETCSVAKTLTPDSMRALHAEIANGHLVLHTSV